MSCGARGGGGEVQEGHRSLFNFVKAIGACMVDYSTEANSCHQARDGGSSPMHTALHGLGTPCHVRHEVFITSSLQLIWSK